MWGRSAQAPRCRSRLGEFVLLRRVGAGGMGIVYEAEHESLKSRMALKVMHPRFRADRDYVRRFQTEARSAAKLHHTNIVPVFDYGQQDGVCYYAMQYIAGVGLERVLEDVRRLRSAANRDAGAETIECRAGNGDRRGCKPAHGHLPRPVDRPVRRGNDWLPLPPTSGSTAIMTTDGATSAAELVRPAARLPASPNRSISARSPA